jgi:hypothetical protein
MAAALFVCLHRHWFGSTAGESMRGSWIKVRGKAAAMAKD